MDFNKTALNTFFYWVAERELVRKAKEAGKPKPWSRDQYLQNFRWCNVRRWDDRVSQWLDMNWYDNSQSRTTLLIAAALARLINWPDTLSMMIGGANRRVAGFTKADWKPKDLEFRMEQWKGQGRKVFTGAYIINGARGGSKIKQVIENVQDVAANAVIHPNSMEETWKSLIKCKGIGSFIAGQIVADLRHTSAMPDPADALRWAPLGPGSARGMRRLLGLEPQGRMNQAEFEVLLLHLIRIFKKHALHIWEDRGLEAMDIQNCLCESDKYNRLKEGGHVRSGYPGAAESGELWGD